MTVDNATATTAKISTIATCATTIFITINAATTFLALRDNGDDLYDNNYCQKKVKWRPDFIPIHYLPGAEMS